jgi:hypothetical protein
MTKSPVTSGHVDREDYGKDVGKEEDDRQVPSSLAVVQHGQHHPGDEGVPLENRPHAAELAPRERVENEPLVESDQADQERKAGHAHPWHGVVVGQIMGVRIEGDLAYFAAGLLGVKIYQFAGLSGAGGPPPPDAPPAILSFALNSGASSTANRVVTLNHTVSGTPTQYRASEAANFAGAAWTLYSAAPTFSVTGANFQVRNAALLESTVVSDTITLSEPAPNVTAYALNGGANTTTNRTITLNNTALNNPTEYRASESSAFTGAVWLPYGSAPTFLLSQGNATKRVYFQARNLVGVSTARSDTINLLEPAPVLGTFAINGGAGSTTSQTVTLNHVATGETPPTTYRASESSTFANAVWLPYTPVPTFTLSPGTATKRVYLQLRNADGVTSAVRSDTIVLYQ